MKENKLQVVVFRRNEDERTCAVVRCKRTESVYDGNTLFGALSSALSRWFTETKAGKTALVASSNDYNIGDLVFDYKAPSLQKYLEQFEVEGLEIETYEGGSTGWDFDDHLFNDWKWKT